MIMGELRSETQRMPATPEWWMQKTLPLDLVTSVPDHEPGGGDAPLQVVRAALQAVEHAPDGRTRLEALARVSAHLAAQATARGRQPVPKPSADRSS
jgi:hypothetical protein